MVNKFLKLNDTNKRMEEEDIDPIIADAIGAEDFPGQITEGINNQVPALLNGNQLIDEYTGQSQSKTFTHTLERNRTYKIKGFMLTNAPTSGSAYVYLRFNNDKTSGNYASTGETLNNGASTPGGIATGSYMVLGAGSPYGYPATTIGYFWVDITINTRENRYAMVDAIIKGYHSTTGATASIWKFSTVGFWRSTAQVTSVEVGIGAGVNPIFDLQFFTPDGDVRY